MANPLCLLPTLVVSTLLLTGNANASAPRMPDNYLPVPLVPQATTYSCGAASLMSILEYWNVYDGPETDLFKPLNTTPNDGTEGASMVALAKNVYGLQAELRTGMTLLDLKDALKDGTTVILDVQAWTEQASVDWKNDWEDGHYIVLVAMDTDYAYFMDPSSRGAYAYIPLVELMDRWHDFENRHGTIQRFIQSGILIHGKQARVQYPAPLVRIQ